MNKNIFVCPLCKGLLSSSEQEYHCVSCARDFPIIDGIPDFFIDDANRLEDQVWRENLIWLDPQMAEARETIYRLSVRALRGMTFAMERLAPLTFPGCRILEVGTGTGHFARWMAEVSAPGTEIVALDFSWPMFAIARSNTRNLPGVFLVRANSIGKLPFVEESFDILLLRLAPLGEKGIYNVQAAFQLITPGGWLFKAGWKLHRDDTPWIDYAIQMGYESAELHEWQYPRARTREEYDASRVECDLAIAAGAPLTALPADPVDLITMTSENLRIAQKPLQQIFQAE